MFRLVMKAHLIFVRLFAFASLVVTAWLFVRAPVQAQGQDALSPEEKRGRQIYLKGESQGGDIVAVLGSSDLDLPASSFPCSNCHGLRGEGSKEGGLQPPPITWATLATNHTSALTGHDRVAYDEAKVARAIVAGIDSSGGLLHPGMPHYKMSAAQMADLISYLRKIGTHADLDPGLSDDSIRVGAALPLSGPLARIGEDVKATMVAYFAEVNAQGGIYGRKIELVTEDSRGDAAGSLEATRTLVEKSDVFALVASFERVGSNTTYDLLLKMEAPLIGPLTLSPVLQAVPNHFVFYLLPSFEDQAAALVEFIGNEQTRPRQRPASRIAVIYSNNGFDRDALAGLKDHVRSHWMQIVIEESYAVGQFSASTAVEKLTTKPPDYVFFFGSPEDFVDFGREMHRRKVEAGILSFATIVGQSSFNLPADVAARTYLSYPTSPPDQEHFEGFLALMKRAGVPIRGAAFQSLAYAAAKVFVEAAKSTGRQMSRSSLISALEQMHEVKTGVIGPVTFGPNRRIGSSGCYVVRVDALKRRYVMASGRIVPKGSR